MKFCVKKERIRLLYLIFFVILIDVFIVDYIFVFLISIFNWICVSEIFVCVVNISFVIFVWLMVGVIMLVCKRNYLIIKCWEMLFIIGV